MQPPALLMRGSIRDRARFPRRQATSRRRGFVEGARFPREADQPALLEHLGRGRARGIPSEAAELTFAALGADSPRLSRNTPHASRERRRITTERAEPERAEPTSREMLAVFACPWQAASLSVARPRPPHHHHRSRECVGHSWRRRGLSERSEFRSLQKGCLARARRITSGREEKNRHNGAKSGSVPYF